VISSIILIIKGQATGFLDAKKEFLLLSEIQNYNMIFICVKLLTKFLIYIKKVPLFKMMASAINKSLYLIKDLAAMFVIVLILFTSVGVNLFGGNISDQTVKNWGEKFGKDQDAPRRGELMMNFNDYIYGIITLMSTTMQGWNHMKIVVFDNEKYNRMIYPYFHFGFFFVANVMLLNVMLGFFINVIMASLDDFNTSCAKEEAAAQA
jgi:hypothetical protein